MENYIVAIKNPFKRASKMKSEPIFKVDARDAARKAEAEMQVAARAMACVPGQANTGMMQSNLNGPWSQTFHQVAGINLDPWQQQVIGDPVNRPAKRTPQEQCEEMARLLTGITGGVIGGGNTISNPFHELQDEVAELRTEVEAKDIEIAALVEERDALNALVEKLLTMGLKAA